MNKISLQQYADEVVGERWKQPLKSLADALTANGWELVDRPKCCGAEVHIDSFLGSPYYADCKACGKFVLDVRAPKFGDGCVRLLDDDKVDLDSQACWIVGIRGCTKI